MANKESKVKISFVSDEAQLNAALQRIESRLGGLEKSAKSAAISLSFQSLQQGIQLLDQYAQKLNEFALQGASFNLLNSEFEKLTNAAGEYSSVVLNELDKAAKGSIAQRDLMLAANKANLLGVGDEAHELTALMEIAVARGDALGRSTTDAFNDIVTGLGRSSALILDNLGIIVDIEKINKQYAASVGKTVQQLSEQEKKQALVNAVIADSQRLLSQGTSIASENQSKIEGLTAAWTDLSDTIAARFTPALAGIAEKTAEAIDSVGEYLTKSDLGMSKALIETLSKVDPNKIYKSDTSIIDNIIGAPEKVELVSNILNRLGVESATTTEVIALLDNEVKKLEDSLSKTGSASQNFGMDLLDLAEQNRSVENAALRNADAQKFLEESLRLSQTELYSLASASAYAASSIDDLSGKMQSISLANAAFESGINRLTNKIIQDSVQAQKTVGSAAAKSLGVDALEKLNDLAGDLKPNLESGYLSVLDLNLLLASSEEQFGKPFEAIEESNRLAQESMRQTGKGAEKLASDTESAFNDLQGRVSSVLSSAISGDIGGINLDDILPRQDALNENARRLADIAVKGFDSPWYSYFQKEFPALFAQFFSGASTNEGIKIQAANVIKNFQDGLVPELIDKETAKDMVRRALIGEQNMAELANEIATELSAELGTSLQATKQLANSVLGGGGDSVKIPSIELSADSLASIPQQFENSFKDSFGGFSESFATNLFGALSAKVVVESSATAGRLNGSNWGSGFMETVGESVPSALIDLLTLKILPNIEGSLKESEQRNTPR